MFAATSLEQPLLLHIAGQRLLPAGSRRQGLRGGSQGSPRSLPTLPSIRGSEEQQAALTPGAVPSLPLVFPQYNPV